MNDTRLAKLMTSPRLPTLPKVAVRILQLVQSPDVSIRQLSDAIAADAALAAKILKTANSGFYGRVRGVATLRDAVMVLGLRNVKTLALGFSLVSDLSGRHDGGLDHAIFWRRSLLAACGARAVARRVGRQLDDEAFLGGLMHGIGVVALDRALGAEYAGAAARLNDGIEAFLEAESRAIGMQHTEVGAMLANAWNLPAPLTASIRYYPWPERADPDMQALVGCVLLGTRCADVALTAAPGHALARFRDLLIRLSPGSEPDAVLNEALEQAAALEQVFERKNSEPLVPAEILARANDALQELSLEFMQESNRLETERVELEREAYTDALTGVANRRHLEDFLPRQTAISQRYGTPLSLLLIDLDHFKAVNDTFGHPVGDAVLRHVAACLASAVRRADFVARYGGEEFVVVLPETPLAPAVELAERIRARIETAPATLIDGHSVRVTVSIGIASVDPRGTGQPAGLVRAADTALYAAKASGRNTVRAAA